MKWDTQDVRLDSCLFISTLCCHKKKSQIYLCFLSSWGLLSPPVSKTKMAGKKQKRILRISEKDVLRYKL